MPEGDTLYRTALTLRKALAGRVVTRFDTTLDLIARIDARTPVAGRTVAAVEAHGKHLMMVLRRTDIAGDPIAVPDFLHLELNSLDLVLHTHMRMTGSWHIYRPGEPWQKPEKNAWVVLHTDEFIAPCFTAPVIELLTARETTRHPQLTNRGSDIIRDDFDTQSARQRLRERSDMPIGVAILDQRTMAGVGNEFKSEVLFIRRVNPFTLVRDIDDATLDGLVAESHRLLQLNRTTNARITRFGLNRNERQWVYGRSGSPCLVCGAIIKMRRQGTEGRSTYYCPACQA